MSRELAVTAAVTLYSKTQKTRREGKKLHTDLTQPASTSKTFSVSDYNITELITATIMSCQKLEASG